MRLGRGAPGHSRRSGIMQSRGVVGVLGLARESSCARNVAVAVRRAGRGGVSGPSCEGMWNSERASFRFPWGDSAAAAPDDVAGLRDALEGLGRWNGCVPNTSARAPSHLTALRRSDMPPPKPNCDI